MGVDFSAYAIIGIKIDKERLYQKPETVKAFDHKYSLSDKIEYCPNTEQKLWKEFQDPIPEWDEDDKLGPYRIYTTPYSDDCIVGLVVCDDTGSNGGNDIDFVRIPNNLTKLKETMKNYLEPLGLWHEPNFGLYSVLYCG